MHFSKLRIKNFKSISYADIDFEPLTLLVGANATGKSNLIQVFRFISDIVSDGIDNAIAMQGGTTYLGNVNYKKGTPIEIGFTLDLSKERWLRSYGSKDICLNINDIQYSFIIKPNLRGEGYNIASDKMSISFDVIDVDMDAVREDRYKNSNIKYTLSAERSSIKSKIQLKHFFEPENCREDIRSTVSEKDITARVFARLCNEDKKELMLHRIAMLLPPFFSEDAFIRIFDFDPKELKKSSSGTSRRALEENGSNLAFVLNNILRTKESRNRLTVLLQDFLPFIDVIKTEHNYDKSYSFKVNEYYCKDAFYANFLSDGTVSIIAIIIALYFETLSGIIILEEPERNIHPKLLANILSSAEDVSEDRQVIMTTHNPEFLKHVDVNNIRLVQRDEKGFTSVTSPKDSAVVKSFMVNDLGLDDLFLQDMLGV